MYPWTWNKLTWIQKHRVPPHYDITTYKFRLLKLNVFALYNQPVAELRKRWYKGNYTTRPKPSLSTKNWNKRVSSKRLGADKGQSKIEFHRFWETSAARKPQNASLNFEVHRIIMFGLLSAEIEEIEILNLVWATANVGMKILSTISAACVPAITYEWVSASSKCVCCQLLRSPLKFLLMEASGRHPWTYRCTPQDQMPWVWNGSLR